MTSLLTRRNIVVYTIVSLVSFNVTVVFIILLYSPNVHSNTRRSQLNIEPHQQQHHEPISDQAPVVVVAAAAADNDAHENDDIIKPEAVPVGSRHNFRLPNRLITEYDVDIADRVTSLAARKATSRDPDLVKLVRDVIDPPPSNKAGYKMFKVSKTPQVLEVESILGDMKGGFFVECGGLDGERLSNTAYLERERNWNGLLVEMDPFFYTQLLGKNRRVWSINACLSPYNYFTTLRYAGDSRGRGQLIVDPSDRRVHSMHSDRQKLVPCFPIETILFALNRTTVNFFSLDVEGFELPILESIDWQQFDIQVLSVEFNRGKDKNAYVDYMLSQNYKTYKEVHSAEFYAHDFIFVTQQIYDSVNSDKQQQQQQQHKPVIKTVGKQQQQQQQQLNLAADTEHQRANDDDDDDLF